MEFLVDMRTTVPEGTSEETVEETKAREKVRAGELTDQGHLLRLWRPPLAPGEWRTFGLFAASDEAELRDLLASLPLYPWMAIEITPFSEHPNDPALAA